MTLVNSLESEEWQIALRKVRRLPEKKGQIPNDAALCILYDHFIGGLGVGTLLDLYSKPERDPTQIKKLLAKHEGKESSRRKDVRRIFSDFCKAIGHDTGIYSTPELGSSKGSRGGFWSKRTPSTPEVVRKDGGAVRGKTPKPKGRSGKGKPGPGKRNPDARKRSDKV